MESVNRSRSERTAEGEEIARNYRQLMLDLRETVTEQLTKYDMNLLSLSVVLMLQVSLIVPMLRVSLTVFLHLNCVHASFFVF